MARHEDILNDIWDDPPFADVSGPAQHIYVWSFTNQRTNMAGLYKVRLAEIGAGKWPARTRDRALGELVDAGLIRFELPWLWVCARIKRITSRSPAMARAVAKDLSRIPRDCPFREQLLARYRAFPWPALREAIDELERSRPLPFRTALESQILGPSPDPPRRSSGNGVQKKNRTATSRSHAPTRDTADWDRVRDRLDGADPELDQLLPSVDVHQRYPRALILRTPPGLTDAVRSHLETIADATRAELGDVGVQLTSTGAGADGEPRRARR